jgi:parallel beta-helix repeat protein
MGPVSMDGFQPVHPRIGRVSTDAFEFRFEEWDYLDGSHVSATVHYVVAEAGTHTLPSGNRLEVGKVDVRKGYSNVRFGKPFESTPVVFSSSQTYNGSPAVITRNIDVSTKGFSVRVQEQESMGGHPVEAVGYVALAPSTTAGYEVARTADKLTHEWYDVTLDQSHDSLVLLADMQTTNDDDPASLRYDGLTADGFSLHLQEETSADSETTRDAGEGVGYLVATPGRLFGSTNSGGGEDTTDPEPSDPSQNSLVIESDKKVLVEYEFTTTKEIVPKDSWETTDEGVNHPDTVTANDDGTWTAAGRVVGGQDAVGFDGEVTAFTPNPLPTGARLYLNGTETTVAELTGQQPSEEEEQQPNDGEQISASEQGGIQAAIDAASPGQVVAVDDFFTEQDIRAKDGVDIVGTTDNAGFEMTSGGSGLDLTNVSDVRIANIRCDGQRNGGFVIGGNDLGTVSNVLIENCVVENSRFNGIGIASKSGDITNVVARNNRLLNNRSHGIIFGVNDGPYTLDSCSIVGNYGNKTDRALMFTMFAGTLQGKAKGTKCKINNNTARHAGGWLIAYEDRIFDSEIKGNDVRYGGEYQSPGGIACTKEASRNVVEDNVVRDVGSALAAKGHPKHPEYGSPDNNEFRNNTASGVKQGIDILGSGTGNVFEQNDFSNWNRKVRDPDNVENDQTIRNNSW